MHYYKHHIGDYKRDTSHLTLLEHGVYRQLIDLYYLTEFPIPNLEFAIKKIGARKHHEKVAVENILNEFFEYHHEGYKHKKCDHLISNFKVTSSARSEAAKSKWLKNKEVNDANALQTGCKQDASDMLPINHKPLTNKPLNISCPIEEKLSDITTVADAPIDSVDDEPRIVYDTDLLPKVKKKSPHIAAAPLLGFNEWYALYPRREGRGVAMKAYAKAIRKAPADAILAGLKRSLADWEAKGTEKQYIPLPATWLNAERWADELQTKATVVNDDRLKLQQQVNEIKKQMGLA